ncbi:somatostatin receptor type 5-like [Leptodactylus fuscus]|uniref:somatostatin receptor type 5-like n=1 Tax=Leptodactylus fuscus TaxID=238119 RepID=UPI003F4F14CC
MDEDMEMENIVFDENFSLIFNSSMDFDLPTDRSTALMAFTPFLVVCLVGLIGNALVLFVILGSKKMWKSMNIFIFSLALGDLLFMLCLLFLAVELMLPLGPFMCKLYWTLTAVSTFSSVYFLAIMSISVFLQAYFPGLFTKLNLKGTVLISLGVWILSLLLGIPFFLYADVDEFSTCRILWPEPTGLWNLVFTSYRFVIAFLAPLILISVCLVLTQCRVRRHHPSTDSSVAGIKEDVVMIMVLSVIFVIFWLPTHLLEIVSGVTSNFQYSEAIYYSISIIPYVKSCIYPCIYGFLSRSFKDSFNRIFCCSKVPEGDNPQKNPNDTTEDKSTVC